LLYTVHVTALSLGGGRFSGHGVQMYVELPNFMGQLAKFRGSLRQNKIKQVLQLATVFHIWLKTETAVQTLQLLKTGIVLRYVSNIKRKSFFLFKSARKLM